MAVKFDYSLDFIQDIFKGSSLGTPSQIAIALGLHKKSNIASLLEAPSTNQLLHKSGIADPKLQEKITRVDDLERSVLESIKNSDEDKIKQAIEEFVNYLGGPLRDTANKITTESIDGINTKNTKQKQAYTFIKNCVQLIQGTLEGDIQLPDDSENISFSSDEKQVITNIVEGNKPNFTASLLEKLKKLGGYVKNIVPQVHRNITNSKNKNTMRLIDFVLYSFFKQMLLVEIYVAPTIEGILDNIKGKLDTDENFKFLDLLPEHGVNRRNTRKKHNNNGSTANGRGVGAGARAAEFQKRPEEMPLPDPRINGL